MYYLVRYTCLPCSQVRQAIVRAPDQHIVPLFLATHLERQKMQPHIILQVDKLDPGDVIYDWDE